MVKITIPGRFPSLNEYIAANKHRSGNWNGGNSMKQKDQKTICHCIPRGVRFERKIFIEYNFFEPNTRRDKDNISGYFHKVFQDALVQAGCIPDDGWKYILGMQDNFWIDKSDPHIEVLIEEIR